MQAIDGLFLSFTPQEMDEIRAGLADYGYTSDKDGLKKFILDSMREDVDDSKSKLEDTIKQFLDNNPDHIRMYGKIASGVLKGILKKRKH